MDREQLKLELKRLLIEECEKKLTPEEIPDDAILIGGRNGLDFDSLDALQISMAVQQRYGKRIRPGNEGRSVLKSVNSLTDFILS
jgi:acyl carrier protein